MTDAQAEKWLGSIYSNEASLAFVEAFELVFEGTLDVPRLQAALDAVVQRHEAFALRFEADGSMQVHDPSQRLRVRQADLSGVPSPLQEYASRCGRERNEPFDTSVAPLVRACLYRLGPEQHRLFMVAHHLVIDGWSLRIVLRDLAALYNGAAQGQGAYLPAADSWVEFARAERTRRDGPEGCRSQDYWRDRFRDLPEPAQLPTDRPRGTRIGFAAANFTVDVPRSLWDGLRVASRQSGVTRFSLLLAAYHALVYRLSGQADLVCGIPFAGAARGAGARLVGDTDNTLPVRVHVDPDGSLRALALQVQQELKEAAAHQDISLGRIVEALRLKRDAGRMLLVDSIVALVPSLERLAFDGVDCRLEVLPRTASAWETGWYWRQMPAGAVQLEVQYRSDLYNASTIRAWCDLYIRLLQACVSAPEATVADFAPWRSPEEGIQMLANDAALAGAEAPSLPVLLQPAFLEHATRPAAECGERVIDYAGLDRRSRRVARALVAAGVVRGELVGIAVPRSLEMLVAVLAVMRAGAAYVPLDPAFPEERLLRMAAHSGLRRIVTADGVPLPPGLAEGRSSLPLGELEAVDATVPLPEVQPDDAAYVLYTSGSTGEPKGVRILHRNLVNFLCTMRQAPGFSREDVICAATTLSFDIAALELYLPLLCGGRVVIAGEEEHRDPEALCRLIEERGCTVFQTTPSTLALVNEVGRAGVLAPLRLLVGGEALPPALAQSLVGRCRELWNMYGPTETTVWSSVQRITPDMHAIPLGQPVARTRLYLLDDRLRPVLPHAVGEIWIAGAGLADGYLHRPDLTAERFLPDPFAGDGSRMYRTGDLGRLHDGQLHFQGRVDDQIKLRGYRIEPGDIEAAAAAETGVAECVVVVRAAGGGDDALVLYAASGRAAADLVPALRARLRQALPAYMRPQYIEVLDRLPRTPNGKIDRRALPGPSALPDVAHGRRSPRTAMETEFCALWRRLLGIDVVGPDDDFFALGGASLQAVRMFAALKERHGVDLPLATLIEHPTPASLAEVVSATRDAAPLADAATAADRWRPLLVMRRGGTWPPLFLFHAVGGNVLNYHPLVAAMDPRLPVYGLQSQGLDGSIPAFADIPRMAEAHARQIAAVRPDGPVMLAGGSMGGILALEVARCLQARGREVMLLAMFDTHVPGRVLGPGWRRLPPRMAAALRMDGAQWADLLRRTRLKLVEAPLARLRRLRDPTAPEPLPLRLRRVERANHAALARYRLRPYAGDLVLFRAPVAATADATLGWSRWIAGHVETHEVHGSHHDLISRPELAERLWQRIEHALGERP